MPFLSHLILWHIFPCKTLSTFQGNPWIHTGFQIHIERKRNLRKVPMTLQWQPGLKKSQKPSILLEVAFCHCNMTHKLKQGQKYHEGFFLKTSWKWFQCIGEDKFDSTDCYQPESIGEESTQHLKQLFYKPFFIQQKFVALPGIDKGSLAWVLHASSVQWKVI